MTRREGKFLSRTVGTLVFVALLLVAATAHAIFVRTAVNYRPYRPVARAAVATAAVVGAMRQHLVSAALCGDPGQLHRRESAAAVSSV